VNESEFAELAAGYAFGALSQEDAAAFEAARVQHPEWEHIIVTDVATVAELADGVEPVAAPLALRGALLSQISRMPQGEPLMVTDAATNAALAPPVDALAEAAASHDDSPGPLFVEPAPTTSTIQAIERKNWTRGLFGLAASLVLLVALGLGAATIGELIGPSPATIALAEIDQAEDGAEATVAVGDGGTATLYWSASLDQAVLVSDGLPAIEDDQAFEMWVVRGEEAPVSAGTFTPGDDSTATALIDSSVEAGDAIAVTVEEAGGSQTGAPTTEPILAIPTA
jgi:anti-sigma-K factor RskA